MNMINQTAVGSVAVVVSQDEAGIVNVNVIPLDPSDGRYIASISVDANAPRCPHCGVVKVVRLTPLEDPSGHTRYSACPNGCETEGYIPFLKELK